MIDQRCRLKKVSTICSLGLDLSRRHRNRAAGLKLELELELGVGPGKAVAALRHHMHLCPRWCKKLDPRLPWQSEQPLPCGKLVGVTAYDEDAICDRGVFGESAVLLSNHQWGKNKMGSTFPCLQFPLPVKSPSDSISGRHCWVMINVVTGARGGVLLLRGTFWPGQVPACNISRKIIGRTAGSGLGFVHHHFLEGTRTGQTIRPQEEAATAMPNSIRAKVLHLHARCSISQTTDTCVFCHIKVDPSAECIH